MRYGDPKVLSKTFSFNSKSYLDDDLLQLAVSINGLTGQGYTRVSLNVNSTYIDSYTIPNPLNPVINPADLPNFSMNLISFAKPEILLRNNNYFGKYLQIYEI